MSCVIAGSISSGVARKFTSRRKRFSSDSLPNLTQLKSPRWKTKSANQNAPGTPKGRVLSKDIFSLPLRANDRFVDVFHAQTADEQMHVRLTATGRGPRYFDMRSSRSASNQSCSAVPMGQPRSSQRKYARSATCSGVMCWFTASLRFRSESPWAWSFFAFALAVPGLAARCVISMRPVPSAGFADPTPRTVLFLGAGATLADRDGSSDFFLDINLDSLLQIQITARSSEGPLPFDPIITSQLAADNHAMNSKY